MWMYVIYQLDIENVENSWQQKKFCQKLHTLSRFPFLYIYTSRFTRYLRPTWERRNNRGTLNDT